MEKEEEKVERVGWKEGRGKGDGEKGRKRLGETTALNPVMSCVYFHRWREKEGGEGRG